MRRLIRPALGLLLGVLLLGAIVLLLSPPARRLLPAYLYYDWVVRSVAPLPPAAEAYVLAAGNDFCAVGRDSECGGFRLVNARALDPASQPGAPSAAWCVDYVVLRRNTSALTGGLLRWAGIPRAMVLAERAGQYEAFQVEAC